MPANSSASKEVVTAALLVIGGKILSGRTKDQNIGYIAEYLTGAGIDLKEVRVVGDEERAIVDALDALRHRTVRADTREGDIGGATRRDRQGQSCCRDRELSILRSAARAQHECGAARPRCTEARAGQTRGREDAGASAASTIKIVPEPL
jgi:hypothetical protein